MEIKSLLENKLKQLSSNSIKNDTNTSKNDTIKSAEWKELGKDLTKHFGQNCYWVPWKFEIWMIYEVFKLAGDKGFPYFLGALRNKKKMYERN